MDIIDRTTGDIVVIITAIGGAIVGIIGSIGAVIAAVISKRALAKTDTIYEEQRTIGQELSVVRHETNGRFTALNNKLTERDAQLAAALSTIHQQELTRVTLAAEAVTQPQQVPVSVPISNPISLPAPIPIVIVDDPKKV